MGKDRVIGFISAAGGIALAIAASMLPASKMSNDIGPKVFPYISAGLLILCGLLLILTKTEQKEVFMTKPQFKKMLIILGVLLMYLVLMWAIGYFIPTLVALFALCTLFSAGDNVAWWKRLVFSAAITVVLLLLFRYVLSLKLPTGMLL